MQRPKRCFPSRSVRTIAVLAAVALTLASVVVEDVVAPNNPSPLAEQAQVPKLCAFTYYAYPIGTRVSPDLDCVFIIAVNYICMLIYMETIISSNLY